jgi:hypothetical protein
MAKSKIKKKAQDFAAPFSVLIFNDDMANLEKLALRSGVGKSVLIRLAVREGLKRKIFDAMVAS